MPPILRLVRPLPSVPKIYPGLGRTSRRDTASNRYPKTQEAHGITECPGITLFSNSYIFDMFLTIAPASFQRYPPLLGYWSLDANVYMCCNYMPGNPCFHSTRFKYFAHAMCMCGCEPLNNPNLALQQATGVLSVNQMGLGRLSAFS